MEQHDDLVHIVRLALSGRTQDVRAYALRLARKCRETKPEVSAQLARLIGENPTPQMPTRASNVAAIPVDSDSRLRLARFDPAPVLNHQPIWVASVAEQLEQVVTEHERGLELISVGLSPTRTAIFTGPPGVGKTMAARWLAVRLRRPLIALDLSAAISSFLGRTGANVRNVLDYAKGVECILLLDEIDALAKRRDDTNEVGELKRLVTVLLQEVDDWPAGGLLVAATNHSELLDPAIWRRFEAVVEFPMPDQTTTRAAVSTFLGADAPLSDQWVSMLAIALGDRSFSDIEREIKSARRRAVLAGMPLETALEQTITRRSAALPKASLKRLAVLLHHAGVSQHQINRVTGLSRDTIRAACSSGSLQEGR